jgi:CO/xanthine dehydrogenase FAD-binding subunit
LKPAEFQYHRPRTVEDALALLKENGDDGKILAGGQSLMPLMNFRLAEPAHLIDINFIDGLDYIRSNRGAIKIGCLTRQSRALGDALIQQKCPLLAAALGHVGFVQTRNRGTLCGSLAHGDPAAELPAVLLALDGSVTVGNSIGKREIAARDFFQSYLTTALASWCSKRRSPNNRLARVRRSLNSRAGSAISPSSVWRRLYSLPTIPLAMRESL